MLNPIDVGIGFVVGAFCPGILRRIKSFFVKEANEIKSKIGQ